MRNGANMRFESTGKVHMFDGDAMLHCFRFKNGKLLTYANTWIRSKRFKNNDSMQKELYPSVGDLSTGGLSIAKKMSRIQLAMRSGVIPHLPDNMRGSPSTSTVFVAGGLYAVVEVSPPFRIGVDPESGAVSSGDYNDFEGRVREFSAHSKISPDTGELHFAAADHITAAAPTGMIGAFALVSLSSCLCTHSCLFASSDMTYGVVSPSGQLTRLTKFPLSFPGPAYLHDYFVTRSFCVVIDHSVRYNISRIAQGSIFQWVPSRTLRFGLISRADDAPVRWFDTGAPGFVWHVLAGWDDGNSVVLWLPVFDSYPESIPIHLPCEPPSHLTRVVLDLDTGLIRSREKFMLDTAVERCDVNRRHFGSEQRWGYLMKRSHTHPMYDGFVKFDLKNAAVNAVVEYGEGCLGGECFFIPKASSASAPEDAGWVVDIVYAAPQRQCRRVTDRSAGTPPRCSNPIFAYGTRRRCTYRRSP
jgi:carotenoid cleavage dioxygenase-like enzyme